MSLFLPIPDPSSFTGSTSGEPVSNASKVGPVKSVECEKNLLTESFHIFSDALRDIGRVAKFGEAEAQG